MRLPQPNIYCNSGIRKLGRTLLQMHQLAMLCGVFIVRQYQLQVVVQDRSCGMQAPILLHRHNV